MSQNNTLTNISDEKLKELVINWAWKLIKYFLPSGAIAFWGIKSTFWINFLITIFPSIIGISVFLVKFAFRYFFIKKKVDKTFSNKELSFEGQGYYFLNLIEEIKKLKGESEEPRITIYESRYISKFKISYSAWKSQLFIKSETESGGVRTSSHSEAFFSFLNFSSFNSDDFEIFFSYQNKKHSLSELNSTQIRNLNNHMGYGRIIVKNLEIVDFTYVSDFTERFSFGSFSQSPIKKMVSERIERN